MSTLPVVSMRRSSPPVSTATAAFIFDVDGVLADTAVLHLEAWRRAVGEHGIPFPAEVADSLRGVTRRESLLRILAGRPISASDFERILRRKNEIYVSLVERLSPDDRLPGVMALLDGLIRRDILIAAASASRNARRVLLAIGLLDQFPVLVDGDEVVSEPGHRFSQAAHRLQVVPARCVVVEDSATNIAIARGLGMRTIGVGKAEHFPDADLALADFRSADLDALLKQWRFLP